jgi:hypothetical protein
VIVTSADKLRKLVEDGELEPGDAEAVLRFAAFLRNAGPPAHPDHPLHPGSRPLPPLTLAYAMGEDVDPEGTEEL